MWSDEEIDGAFRRLAPPEPEPESFPLDAWLRLESQLDKDLMERQFRQRLWKFFAGEMAVVALLALAWLLWPSQQPAERLPKIAGTTVSDARSRGAATAAKAQTAATGLLAATTRPAPASQLQNGQSTPAEATAPANSPSQPEAVPTTRATPPTAAGGPALAFNPTNTSGLTAGPEKRRKSARLLPTPVATPEMGKAGEPIADRKQPATAQRTSALATVAAATASRRTGRLARPVAEEAQGTAAARAAGNGLARSTGRRPAGMLTASVARKERNGLSLARTARASGAAESAAKPGLAAKAASAGTHSSEGARLKKANNSGRGQGGGEAAPGAAQLAAPAAPTELAVLETRSVSLLTEPVSALPGQLAPGAVPSPAALPVPERQPRLYVGLLASPDVSTVKMADYRAPKANLGLLVEYRLSQRLRLSSGVLRGTKVYRARREDYDWSYNPYASLGKFEWVEGSCAIIDVPLNLRYDLQQRPRYQVFATVGLSTLFMQREKYAYDYTYDSIPPTYPGYPPPPAINKSGRWESEYVNENQHWFSVLNLSFGYERRLGQHWSLQAEPYVKVPLGGVGAGKVKLASGGVFFGVKYGF